ncbi:hypothetical protein N7535_008007 [Penicillium sp. DV-2018c]|nr:hypothetical protein N7535_008007 [Penicillium sp. DV-2018c]
MTIFYQGSLQEGISAAVRDTKAVICFVRDDEELSSTWEETYFGDEEVVQALDAKAVVLRLTAGSQEAGFLASFCPITKFPTVILINNGNLKEYIGPDVSKDDFRSRLVAALKDDQTPAPSQQARDSNPSTAPADLAPAPSPAPAPAPAPAPSPAPTTAQTKPQVQPKTSKYAQSAKKAGENAIKQRASTSSTSQAQAAKRDTKGKAPMGSDKSINEGSAKSATKPTVPRGPPTEYRLQVRLFDGSSVRSSFTPTQTIRDDVRPWLDAKMEGDKRPYNLKHVLTPLPSETLSASQEAQTLRDLGLGSTANLVMVPVSTYTDAYSAAGSLPVRGISAIYSLASSAASTATGIVGSFLGYGSAEVASEPASSSAPPAGGNTQRPRTGGPNIRTLRDQQDERGNSQLYNGNQLNFEPRKDQEDKDK